MRNWIHLGKDGGRTFFCFVHAPNEHSCCVDNGLPFKKETPLQLYKSVKPTMLSLALLSASWKNSNQLTNKYSSASRSWNAVPVTCPSSVKWVTEQYREIWCWLGTGSPFIVKTMKVRREALWFPSKNQPRQFQTF